MDDSRKILNYASGGYEPLRKRARPRHATWASFTTAVLCGVLNAPIAGLFFLTLAEVLPLGRIGPLGVMIYLGSLLSLIVTAPVGTIAGIVFLRTAVLWDDRYLCVAKVALLSSVAGGASLLLVAVLAVLAATG